MIKLSDMINYATASPEEVLQMKKLLVGRQRAGMPVNESNYAPGAIQSAPLPDFQQAGVDGMTEAGDASNPYDQMDFGQAFATARKSGADQFMWRGKPYTTQLAGPNNGGASKRNRKEVNPKGKLAPNVDAMEANGMPPLPPLNQENAARIVDPEVQAEIEQGLASETMPMTQAEVMGSGAFGKAADLFKRMGNGFNGSQPQQQAAPSPQQVQQSDFDAMINTLLGEAGEGMAKGAAVAGGAAALGGGAYAGAKALKGAKNDAIASRNADTIMKTPSTTTAKETPEQAQSRYIDELMGNSKPAQKMTEADINGKTMSAQDREYSGVGKLLNEMSHRTMGPNKVAPAVRGVLRNVEAGLSTPQDAARVIQQSLSDLDGAADALKLLTRMF